MTPRTAAYARYSSDRQSPASIQDQLRNCRWFAEQREWVFQDEHVYTDEALSGAGADRPGLVKLLDAAGQLPRPFDVVLLDDTSRLSRNIGDIARVFEKLNFTGMKRCPCPASTATMSKPTS
jgi:DNA invertase Pin-like site-specific DNA recombinase